jgi:tetratricopeptide (TPR) repeat protein
MRLRAVSLCFLWLAGPGAAAALAQDPSSFDRAFAAFVGADAAGKAAAATAAATAFLGLPAGSERAARLLEGAEALVADARSGLAAEVVAEARALGMRNGRLARVAVAAGLRSGSFAAAMASARLDVVAWPVDVRAAMVADEALVAAAAEQALRQGGLADGRFAFEQLAAATPQAAYRVANFALCLRQLGEIEAARRQYALALALAPDDLEIANDFGLFLRAHGDLAGALAAFQRGWQLDLARPAPSRARGPAVTNLVHLVAVGHDVGRIDVMVEASRALAVRPDAAMLRRLTLDVAVDRAAAPR